jgi:hypothetical protein
MAYFYVAAPPGGDRGHQPRSASPVHEGSRGAAMGRLTAGGAAATMLTQ